MQTRWDMVKGSVSVAAHSHVGTDAANASKTKNCATEDVNAATLVQTSQIMLILIIVEIIFKFSFNSFNILIFA